MPSNERILKAARDRWKCHTDTESLICEVRALLAEIENYRIMVVEVRKSMDKLVSILREKGGE